MPARLFQVTILNSSDFPVRWVDDGRPHGFWQDPWYPSNIKNLLKGQAATFRLESGGIATGVEGWALFKIDIPSAEVDGPRTEFFRLDFKRPYLELSWDEPSVTVSLHNPQTSDQDHPAPQLSNAISRGYADIANIDSSPFEFIPAIPGQLLTSWAFLINEAIPKHVAWFVEVIDLGIREVIPSPLKVASKGIVYALTPRVEVEFVPSAIATTQAGVGHGAGTVRPASGGDLTWFRHDGRLDGAFDWEGPEKVGARWDVFARIFHGGTGLVYGVTPRIESAFVPSAVLTAEAGSGHGAGTVRPASGGDLMWYRHTGEEDGTFRWEGPKKVGARWDVFKHVFSGGDGVIYGVQENGDLMWYRHVGRADGSFIWQGPRKVGSGWGDMTHVFAAGDGIIYAITPRVDASVHITGGVVPASGGALLWFRHKGFTDGSFDWDGPRVVGDRWDAFSQVFSAGNRIIYAITKVVPASYSSDVAAIPLTEGLHGGGFIPASGGDLMWYFHVGAADGTFNWKEPRKVGSGWGAVAIAFAGDAFA